MTDAVREVETERPFFFARPGDACLVYVMESDHGTKVGVNEHPRAEVRRAAIQAAAGMPVWYVKTYAFRDRAHAFEIEAKAHLRLAETRRFGEWFHCHPLEAVAVLDRLYADERMAAA